MKAKIKWKTIPKWKGYYKASSNGKIKSLERIIYKIRNEKKISQKVTEKILTPFVDKDGYKCVLLSRNGKTIYTSIHRLVAMTFLSNPQNKPMVNHKDGNKANNHVSNLEWCTHKENEKHALINGLKSRGSNFSSAKLHETDIPTIRKQLKDKVPATQIARKYGVHSCIIYGIRDGKLWRHA